MLIDIMYCKKRLVFNKITIYNALTNITQYIHIINKLITVLKNNIFVVKNTCSKVPVGKSMRSSIFKHILIGRL